MTVASQLARARERDWWIASGCDAHVAMGLRQLASELTPSHSLTSRRYPVWSHVKKHLDRPFADCIAAYQGRWPHKLLYGLRLSRAGRCAPNNTGVLRPAEAPEVRRVHGVLLSCPMDMPEIDWQLRNVAQWDHNLRVAIHGIIFYSRPRQPIPRTLADWSAQGAFKGARKESIDSLSRERGSETRTEDFTPADKLCATLDSIRFFFQFLRSLRPQTGKNNGGILQRDAPRLPDAQTRPQGDTYCELCWRPTMRSELLIDSAGPYSSVRRYTDRFCRVHNPSDPASEYQADTYYRELFQHELTATGPDARNSVYAFHFKPPRGASVSEQRKAIYDLVHAFPRRRLSAEVSDFSFLERVWLLQREDRRNIDIARQLGVSKQAVGRAVKKLDEIARTYATEAEISLDTHEPFSLAVGETPRLFVEVAELRQRGLTIAQIARQVQRFKATIKTVYRWLDDKSSWNAPIKWRVTNWRAPRELPE